MALVNDRPGVTRDWREGEGRLFDMRFRVIDTAGLEGVRAKGSLSARVAQQTRTALDRADAILLMVDARAGLMQEDETIARELRKTGKPIILLGNKCESATLPASFDEALSLGFGDPLPVSAAHGDGMAELYEALQKYKPEEGDEEETEEEKSLILAVIGRPNAGKSTLINRLIGQDRMLTGPEPGLTRDAIPIAWEYGDRPVRLVDTAGMRRRARVTEELERLSVQETLRAVRLAHVVVLVLDSTQPFDKQDLILAQHVVEEGRALVVALNKWDLVKDKKLVARQIREKAQVSLAQAEGVSLVEVCALEGEGLDRLMRATMRTYDTWNIRVPTNKLNRWLEKMEETHPPPITAGRRIKLRYITQIKSRPPTFSLWVNKPVDLPESYRRFLTSGLRQTFGFEGVPIRWQMKKSANPYEGKKKKT